MDDKVIKTCFVAEWFFKGKTKKYWSRNFAAFNKNREKITHTDLKNAIAFVFKIAKNVPGVEFRVVKVEMITESVYTIKTTE